MFMLCSLNLTVILHMCICGPHLLGVISMGSLCYRQVTYILSPFLDTHLGLLRQICHQIDHYYLKSVTFLWSYHSDPMEVHGIVPDTILEISQWIWVPIWLFRPNPLSHVSFIHEIINFQYGHVSWLFLNHGHACIGVFGLFTWTFSLWRPLLESWVDFASIDIFRLQSQAFWSLSVIWDGLYMVVWL